MWAYGISRASRQLQLQKKQKILLPSQGIELLDVPRPTLNSGEVLIETRSSALNFNSIWSSLARPVDPFMLISNHVTRNPHDADHQQDFAIFGSDASGVVVETAPDVTRWSPGDEVVVHCNVIDPSEPSTQADSMTAASQSIWGYETNYGAFAQYTKVRQNQLLPKPANLDWPMASSLMLTLSTAYRMLISPNGAQIKAGDTVLIWGAAGGLGCFAIQLAKLAGARVVAVVSSAQKKELCLRLGADVVLDREQDGFTGFVNPDGSPNYLQWNKAKRLLQRSGIAAIDVVFEHVGRETLGLSIYLTRKGGKIVTCAASSGFLCTIDLRYLWMELKTLIGSHFANYAEASDALALVASGQIVPVIDSVNPIASLPEKLDDMFQGRVTGKIVFDHSLA